MTEEFDTFQWLAFHSVELNGWKEREDSYWDETGSAEKGRERILYIMMILVRSRIGERERMKVGGMSFSSISMSPEGQGRGQESICDLLLHPLEWRLCDSLIEKRRWRMNSSFKGMSENCPRERKREQRIVIFNTERKAKRWWSCRCSEKALKLDTFVFVPLQWKWQENIHIEGTK